MNDGNWFAPKRFGYGAGVPISWQGWVASAMFCAAVAATAYGLIPRHPAVGATMILVLTAAFVTVAAQHTRGGWKWRWGGEG